MPQQIENAVLDGSGNAVLRFGQAPLMRYWTYNRVSVSIDTGQASAPRGTASLYRGEPIPSNFVTGTRTPWQDTAGFPGDQLRLTSPEYITLVFRDCDPGAFATVVAEFYEKSL